MLNRTRMLTAALAAVVLAGGAAGVAVAQASASAPAAQASAPAPRHLIVVLQGTALQFRDAISRQPQQLATSYYHHWTARALPSSPASARCPWHPAFVAVDMDRYGHGCDDGGTTLARTRPRKGSLSCLQLT